MSVEAGSREPEATGQSDVRRDAALEIELSVSRSDIQKNVRIFRGPGGKPH